MRIFALSLGLILSFGSALAQDFRFMLEEELSSKLVREIYQDSDGFIWAYKAAWAIFERWMK